MCFSANASFSAAAILGAIGIASVLKIPNRRALPLALIPCLTALQQLMEGIIWTTGSDPNLASLQSICSLGFLIIALVLWPVWFPWSAYLLEKKLKRKKAILAMGVTGCASSFFAIYFLIQYGTGLTITCNHISYRIFTKLYTEPFPSSLIALLYIFSGLYLLSILMPLFISSVKFMWLIGLCILIGFIIAVIFYSYAFGSVWCFIGGVTSALIYFIIRKLHSFKM